MEHEIQILIADDHPIFRKGLLQVVESSPNMNVLCEVEDGLTALKHIEKLQPHVAVLDVDMPGMNGIELAKEIYRLKLPTKIIILTMYKEEDLFNEALDHGVLAYLLKDNAAKELLNAIQSVIKNEYYICPVISSYLVNRNSRSNERIKTLPTIEALTHSEKLILRLIAESKTSKEIAEDLHISFRTVENHRTNICNKLDLHGSHALLKFAFDNKNKL